MMGNSNSQDDGIEARANEDMLLNNVRLRSAVTVEALLQQGVNPLCRDEEDNTALHLAAEQGDHTILSLLLQYKPNIYDWNNKNVHKETPLMLAAKKGHATVLRLLLNEGNQDEALVNDYNDSGGTLLMVGASHGHTSVVEVLLTCDNIHIDMTTNTEMTALHCSVLYGHFEAFHLLMLAGADPWIADSRGCYPLMSASIRGFTEIVQMLLNTSCSRDYVNCVNSENFTALHMAVRMDFVGIAEVLIDAGADVNVRDNMGLTPVMWAAQYGREQLTRVLIHAGSDTLNSDVRGMTILHRAAFFGWCDIVDDLLTLGADSVAQSTTGNTPLILAVRNNHFHIIKRLLEHNCDVSIPDRLRGRFDTLLVLSLERGREDVCELLYRAGCGLAPSDIHLVQQHMHPIHPTGVIAKEWVNWVLHRPRPLQDVCRITIRNVLRSDLRPKTQRLPLPATLQSFILLDDVQYEEP